MVVDNTLQWPQALANCIEQQGQTGFYASLIDALASLCQIEYPQIWLFQHGKVPAIIYHQLSSKDTKVHLDQYIAGAYQQDPAYMASTSADQSNSSAVYRITEIFAEQVKQNEYLKGYFARMNTCDEVGYVIELDNTARFNVSLMRGLNSKRYSDDDIQQLKQAEPIVRELLKKHWQLNAQQEDAQGLMSDSVSQALLHFGTSLLSSREQQVVQLLLRGYSTTVAAEKLVLSKETIRLHRKHIYKKLDINTQSELFSLFIHSLPYAAQTTDQDPLCFYQAYS